ncbi:hypothetical protein Tco_0221371 [Tanacetum coccineum]
MLMEEMVVVEMEMVGTTDALSRHSNLVIPKSMMGNEVSFVRILRLKEVARVTTRIALEFAPEFVYVYRLDFVVSSETFWMWIFLWKETRLRQLMSSLGAPSTPSYSAGHSTPLSCSSGPSTPPRYSSGPSTPTNYSLGSSRNAECSNCKHLRGKISVLKATMEMHMHPE